MSQFIRHLSVRVPWHDTGWTACLCKNPEKNVYCTALKNIWENKKAGSCLEFHAPDKLPPCIKEKCGFLNPNPLGWINKYPYTYLKDRCGHFRDTPFTQAAYSAATIPYRWMLRGHFDAIKEQNHLSWELEECLNLTSKDTWWQDKENQAKLFSCFYREFLKENTSLCFFYVKSAPFVEEAGGRRIIAGVGRITKIEEDTEYLYSTNTEGMHRALCWEHNIHHSLRPDNFEGGILLPYHRLLDHEAKHPGSINWEKCTVYSDPSAFERFSYGTEHLFHEDCIDVLLKMREALKESGKILRIDYSKALLWIDHQLSNLWKLRGTYPAFGEVLERFGFPDAYEIEKKVYENCPSGDYWEYFEANLDSLSTKSESINKNWQSSTESQKTFWYNLSRIALSKTDISNIDDSYMAEYAENPYLLSLNGCISVETVDRAFYPSPDLNKYYPTPKGLQLADPYDPRRLLGITDKILKEAASQGHTLVPSQMLIQKINGFLDKSAEGAGLSVTNQHIAYFLDTEWVKKYLVKINLKNSDWAVQLDYYHKIRDFLEKEIKNRVERGLPIDNIQITDSLLETIDNRLDEEQKKSLKCLASNRFSVLCGAAGTGKTRLIKALCGLPGISQSVLILAPTGKSRTLLQKLESEVISVNTVAGYLQRSGRFEDWEYLPSFTKEQGSSSKKTVIIDECSMLTEDMLCAVWELIYNAERIILVGDENQLPPIGAGKPFADIIHYLQNSSKQASHLLKLTKNYRQNQGASIPFALAFSGNRQSEEILPTPAEDLIFQRWDSYEEIGPLLEGILKEEGIHDHHSFICSMGGKMDGERSTLWNCCLNPARWQILSPSRQNNNFGTNLINKNLHVQFHKVNLEQAYYGDYGRQSPLPSPLGEQSILFGAKVINLRNQKKQGQFLANGEIGIVTGRLDKTKNKDTDYLMIQFENLAKPISFYNSDFSADKDTPLELAYALTVHKAQGSQFGVSIVVLPKNMGSLLSREMIYTALTRHSERLIILHEGPLIDFLEFSKDKYSNIASRMTNFLQKSPDILFIQELNTYFDANRIHRTTGGLFVRSKSELAIANLLHKHNVSYEYEKKLDLGSEHRLPDFTIERADIGITYIWEHLGMLENEDYRRSWERKKALYREHGILPAEENPNAPYQLIVTQDDQGALDSAELEEIITKYLV